VILTKLGHACVQLQAEGSRVVIDPGSVRDSPVLEAADAILVTHEHFDHFSESRVRAALSRNASLQVWTVPTVAEALLDFGDRVHAVEDGQRFLAAGIPARAHVQLHATVHPDVPAVLNAGFLLAGCVFHPGDALTVPGVPVDTLLVPVHASWLRVSDVIEWVRAVAPRQAVGFHDSGLSRLGRAVVHGLLGPNGPGIGSTYLQLEDGVPLTLPKHREPVDDAPGPAA
jgi:L-ascorbate metabolism protein UlaG (beta-lactamase superfamily)